MSTFEYLAALVSVVVGLGIAQALRGVGHMVHARESVKIYGPHLMWLFNSVVWMVVFWWFSFGLAVLPQWRLPDLLWVLFYAAIIYFLVALLLPDPITEDFEPRKHFHKTRPWFFTTLFFVGLAEIADYWVKVFYQGVLPPQQGLKLALYVGLLALWLVGSLIARKSESEWFHRSFPVVFIIVALLWTTYLEVW